MTTQHPLAWVTRITENIRQLDEIPQFGHAPPLDWERVTSLLSARLGQSVKVKAKGQKWIPAEELGTGSGSDLLVIPVSLSPLSPPLFWAMSKRDREKFTGWMLGGQVEGKTFSSGLLQEGYYRFLLLEVLAALQSIDPLQQLTLQIGEETSLPSESAFCI